MTGLFLSKYRETKEKENKIRGKNKIKNKKKNKLKDKIYLEKILN